LLQTSYSGSKLLDNLYVVFAGGDDCFIVGAWDAVVEFAVILQKKFSEYEQKIRVDLPILKAPITLSAAVILVDHHFPVVQFAERAEELLHQAKTFDPPSADLDASGKPMKNRINFLGRVFTWSEFAEVIKVKDNMVEMIKKHGEGRAFLQRIIDSFENEDTLRWQLNEKPFDPALLWRFLYHFRDIRHKDYFTGKRDGGDSFFQYFFGNADDVRRDGVYRKYLWDHFDSSKSKSQVLPVAARWTELLTR
jgi:CRISPR-associated protein Csm1